MNDYLEEIIIDGHRYEDGTGTVFIYSCLKGEYTVIDKIRAVEYPSPNIETIYDLEIISKGALSQSAKPEHSASKLKKCQIVLCLLLVTDQKTSTFGQPC